MSNQTIIESFNIQLKAAGYRSGVESLGNGKFMLTANGNGHPRSRQNRIAIETNAGSPHAKIAWATPENARLTFVTVPMDQVMLTLKQQGFIDW